MQRLRVLYRDPSAAADEAIAVMSLVTLGDAPTDDHDCEVLDRGRRMLPLLRRFHDGRLETGFELRDISRRSAVTEAQYRRVLLMLERYLGAARFDTKSNAAKPAPPILPNARDAREACAPICEKIEPSREDFEQEIAHAKDHYKNADEGVLRTHIMHAMKNEAVLKFLEAQE